MNVYIDANNTVLAVGLSAELPAGLAAAVISVTDAVANQPGLALVCTQRCTHHTFDPNTQTVGHYPLPVVNANQGFINHLNGLTLSGDAATLRDEMVNYLQGQPAVPAL